MTLAFDVCMTQRPKKMQGYDIGIELISISALHMRRGLASHCEPTRLINSGMLMDMRSYHLHLSAILFSSLFATFLPHA